MRHGSNIDPPNRFETVHREPTPEDMEWDTEYLRQLETRDIRYIEDSAKTIVSENTSPDIPFQFSVNPYRGCSHGCSYCYARASHEYLGFSAGLDFETQIMVKKQAPGLLKTFLEKPSWKPQPIAFSGVTDCYQPAERQFYLTRQCLEVVLQYRQPVTIITKNALVVRDIDLLTQLAKRQLVNVYLSITTLDNALARDLEPRTSIPSARLRAIRLLSAASIPTGVMLAPIIPGLNDAEIPAILTEAAEAGARAAGHILLRLPQTVEVVFQDWLRRAKPEITDRVINRLRQTRNGRLNDATWGRRMTGSGPIADQIATLVALFRRKTGLEKRLPALNCDDFQRPQRHDRQLRLF